MAAVDAEFSSAVATSSNETRDSVELYGRETVVAAGTSGATNRAVREPNDSGTPRSLSQSVRASL